MEIKASQWLTFNNLTYCIAKTSRYILATRNTGNVPNSTFFSLTHYSPFDKKYLKQIKVYKSDPYKNNLYPKSIYSFIFFQL